MATGIKLPVETKNGRMVKLSGDAYIEQCVYTMLGDGESDNPWQDIGMGEDMIFDMNDDTTQGEIRVAIEKGFRILERDQLAKLEDMTFELDRGAMGAEKKLLLSYRNMETQERREMEVPLPPTSYE